MADRWEEEGTDEEEDIQHYCPQSWRWLPPDVEVCPFCNVPAVTELPEETPLLLTIAGAAAMGVTVLSLLAALMSFPIALFSIGEESPFSIVILPAILVINIIGIFLSVIAASYCWERKHPNITVVSVAMLPFVGLMNIFAASLPFKLAFGFGFALSLFGVPIIVLSLFSLTLIIMKQREFKREPKKPMAYNQPSEKSRSTMVRIA